jgi:hypothetical protein
LAAVKPLAAEYYQLTGKPLGVTGEAKASHRWRFCQRARIGTQKNLRVNSGLLRSDGGSSESFDCSNWRRARSRNPKHGYDREPIVTTAATEVTDFTWQLWLQSVPNPKARW